MDRKHETILRFEETQFSERGKTAEKYSIGNIVSNGIIFADGNYLL